MNFNQIKYQNGRVNIIKQKPANNFNMINQRNNGSAIMLISEDLDELFKISDRLLVLYEGKIIKEFNINEANTNNVGLAMAGVIE